VSLAGVKEQFV